MQLSQLLVVKNMQTSVKFYEEVLGFTLSEQHAKNDAGELTYAMLTNGETSAFHIMPEGAHMRTQFPMRTSKPEESFNHFVSIYVDTDADVNNIAEKAKNAGVQIHNEPARCDWCQGYYIYFTDINGHLWYIASYQNAKH